MVRETDSSLPGIGLALTMTVSPGWISTKRWSRFALRAGRGDDELGIRVVLDLVLGHDPGRVVGQVAQVGRDTEVLFHGAADDGDAAAHVRGGVEDLLDAGDVAGEGGHDDAALERL